MNKFTKILLIILCVIGFTSNVYAASASSSITVNNSGNRYEYISGLPIYYVTASGYNLYVLNSGTYYENRTTLTNPEQANNGFAYIVNNSNVTNSSYKNYYIAQAAILWYQDYLNGNDANISSSLKSYISSTTNDTVCYYINKLVNNAKNYSKNGNNIKFLDNEITFTRNGSYYYSNVIDVETYNLNSTPSVRLYNAPTSASVINNTVTSNGVGSFQIRIPSSSLSSFTERDFEVYITSNSSNNTVYKYSNYGIGEAIYGRSYSSYGNDMEASMPVHINGIGNTRVRINILDNRDNYISGLSYSIYNGNCTNSTCYSADLVQNFTTKNTYTELNNVLGSGVFTLVNKSGNSRYNLPYKTKFTIDNTTSVQDINIVEGQYYDDYNYNDNDYNDNNNYYDDYNDYYDNNNNYYDDSTPRKVNIYNTINDSSYVIKIYTSSNILMKSYKSNITNYEASLTPGTYYIVDTGNHFNKLYFKITNDGSLLVKYDDDYVKASYINLDGSNYQNSIIDGNTSNNDNNSSTYYIDGNSSIEILNDVDTTTDVKIDWLSNIIDCPITSLNATVKYIIGAMVVVTGAYLVLLNVKKNKNNI